MRLFLIRHGQTPSNVIGALDTAVPGPALTALGRQQAEDVGALLAAEPIAAVYASTQQRAQQTARPLAERRALDVLVRDGLREVTAGELEMLTDRAAVTEYLETCLAWASGELDLRMRGGESGHEAFGRFDAVIAEIAESGHDSVALVSHGAMLRAWSGYAVRNLSIDFVAGRPLTNAGVVVLDGDGSHWHADSWLGAAVTENPARCPCLSGESYAACCGRLHRGEATAATAEALMRSRFSAFAVGDASYLLRSWHSATRPAELELDERLRWYRLDIEGTSGGGLLDASGTVEFTAYYRDGAERGSQHENSRFEREAGQWVYRD